MTQPAIRVEGLWKEYVVGTRATAGDTFYDMLSGLLRRPFGKDPTDEPTARTDRFWALRDVSFEVQPGEVVGIIGRNGAGKSTLLKILSRITAPTKGRVEVRGRLASLLEVGTGFHPELTGRENIFLNGAILGMTRREIARKFDEIVAFAEVEKFIDTPVKRYSSGMYVRLAFAVAAHLDSDVLVVDEVLAVGDAVFQDKCLGKMGELSSVGRTVLLVSHNLSSVARLCGRGIVLAAGQKIADAPTPDALAAYARAARGERRPQPRTSGPLSETIRLEAVTLNGREDVAWGECEVSPEEAISIEIDLVLAERLREFRVTLCLQSRGERVLGMHDAIRGADAETGRYRFGFDISSLTLPPGDYDVEINAYSQEDGRWVQFAEAGRFTMKLEWFPLYEPTHAMGRFNVPREGKRMRLSSS